MTPGKVPVEAIVPPYNQITKPKKTSVKVHRTYNMPTLGNFVETAFKEQLRIYHNDGKQLEIGDLILARMKGFSPWPGRCTGFTNKNKMIKCYFFGTHNIGLVGAKNAIPFMNSFEIVRLISLTKPCMFAKGVREIEIECKIPEQYSCLKELEFIE